MSDTTFTFRVAGIFKAAFAETAKARDRTGAQLLRDFMRGLEATSHVRTGRRHWQGTGVEPKRKQKGFGGPSRARTCNQRIMSPLL